MCLRRRKKELNSLITLVAWECKSEHHNFTADNHKWMHTMVLC
jgi:hypothetical protein